MKKIASFVFLATYAFSAGGMIPPVPDIGSIENKRQALRECKVPPQLVVLPPEVDIDYKTCVNKYYEPDIKRVQAKLDKYLGNGEQVLSVSIAQGYIRAYEISYEIEENDGFFSFGTKKKVQKKLICNDIISNCYKIESSLFFDKKSKDQK